jgi:ComEC/Rec2-related protein
VRRTIGAALARRGVALVGSVKSAALVDITRHGSFFDEAAAAGRGWIRTTLAATVEPWGARSAAVARAILIGDRSALAEDDERRLQAAGTYHVIAISGGNIAILTVLVLATLRALRVPSRISAGVAMALLLAYSRVVVPAPSVDRAIMAALIYLGGRLLDHRGPPLNVLCIAAIAALGTSPTTAFDPGFILSVGATLGILILVPRVMRGRTSWYVRGLVGLLAATAAADRPWAVRRRRLLAYHVCGACSELCGGPADDRRPSSLADCSRPLACCAGRRIPAGYLTHLAAVGLVDSARLVDVAPGCRVSIPAGGGCSVLLRGARDGGRLRPCQARRDGHRGRRRAADRRGPSLNRPRRSRTTAGGLAAGRVPRRGPG